MAPKQRSQTPRQPGVANPSESFLHQQQATTTFFSDQPDQPAKDRRRRQRDSPRPISSAQSPSQEDTIALSRSPIVSDSPASPVEGAAQGFSSRRESSSTMRTSSVSLDMVPTCTPTGRISKAKKGKRVHACEFPGCGKVFTRAEHRRRHELNHNPEALFPCTRPGCRKAFHRMDLLQRHQERHDLESAADATASGHMNQMAQVSVTSEPSSVMPAPVMTSPQADRSAPRSSSGGLSIGSLVHPQQQDYRYGMGTPAFNGFPQRPMHYLPGYNSADDSIFYTPESSQSPVSEYYGRYPHRQSISSSSSVAAFDPSAASPMIAGTMPGPWVPSSGPPSILPSTMLDDGTYLPVCAPFHWIGAYTEADQSPADSTIPIPLSDLDGIEWSVIRRELSNASGLQSGNASTSISDTIRWDCLDLYWQYFHPSYPLIHRPSFLPTKPSPLLASAMLAIGSQYDSRPDAKLYSLTLLEIATKLLRRRDNITSRSRLADLQTVFLLEILSKFCARRVEVEMSARFRSLFASLDQARRTLATDPLAVLRTLPKERTTDDIQRAHKFWLEHETRRRILQACTVLDLQQVVLFEQPATIVHHERPRRAGPNGLRLNVSLPCSEELWETSPIEEWIEMASGSATSPSSSKARPSGPEPAFSSGLDYFQIQVSLAANQGLPLDQLLPRNDQTGESTSRLIFNRHARDMAKNAPIRQLLVVSGESWIIGKKLENEAEFQDAKRNLRVWIDSNRESRVALWHATQLIRSRAKFSTSDPTNTELSVSFHDTHMLHEPWAFYLAALVCWAYGFSASTMAENSGHASGAASATSEPTSNPSRSSSLSSAHPTLLDSHEAAYSMREYLQNTNVKTVDDLLRLDPQVFGRMNGLLEIVRLHKVSLFLGGLMNEAERVLYRLVEGRSRLSHF
ncbi:uncharacterized protein Z520_01279 [Fonsecaea multimorphosa CBS 102226]|uniref:C2H2-type domain-containing protein n=1 Tax=Fonsecaea multimorphosa CBS 102226 TaxID=1442371 RepID=A0A0D2L1A0_9EURO|nr:uncharacterized protein Z520_01279 [Fonsecaea multimorphosa CBS 102226]KIY02814.1 hypothetical protein Z520_01279 [Fonsecaea multimorphosa CBS 102226]